jgi:hypothetical protein
MGHDCNLRLDVVQRCQLRGDAAVKLRTTSQNQASLDHYVIRRPQGRTFELRFIGTQLSEAAAPLRGHGEPT